MRGHRPTPTAPLSLFTPPHSWQGPAQRWPGAQRVRAERGGAFPLVAPPRGPGGGKAVLKSEPERRWAETAVGGAKPPSRERGGGLGGA